MKKILGPLSFALIAVWMFASGAAVYASTPSFSPKESNVSSPMSSVAMATRMSELCVKHHPNMSGMTDSSSEADVGDCSGLTFHADCKMNGSDHCSNTFYKYIVGELKLDATSTSVIKMYDSRQVLAGISTESLSPPPRS